MLPFSQLVRGISHSFHSAGPPNYSFGRVRPARHVRAIASAAIKTVIRPLSSPRNLAAVENVAATPNGGSNGPRFGVSVVHGQLGEKSPEPSAGDLAVNNPTRWE